VAATSGSVHAKDWVTGLSVPWGLHVLARRRAIVGERDTGRIMLVTGKVSTITEIADIAPGPEGGLLGLRLSPDGDQLYAYHSTSTDNRVSRFPYSDSKVGKPTVILDGIPHAVNHDGGQLAFGPDGMLYVSTGDALNSSDAQDRGSLAGKILRITSTGKVPSGNPFGNRVWSYGHRNVQGLAFDPDGRLWASEFGNHTADELNLIQRGGNYGWPTIEGDESKIASMINPKATWPTDEASPSGLAWWRGSLWMAGLKGARLWQIPTSGSTIGKPVAHFTSRYGRLRAVAAYPDGSALLLGTSNRDGRGTPRTGDDRLMEVTPAA